MQITETYLQFNNALTKRSKTQRIVAHHTAAEECDAETIHRWHLSNGWSGCGYHFIVRCDGSIERGRPMDKIGAHCTNHNSDSIGVCFEGNFQEQQMSIEQLHAGQELFGYLLDLYDLDSNAIVRHKDLMATSCPGKNFPFQSLVEGAAVASKLQKKKTANNKKQTTHTVKKNDTLYSLAKKYGTTVKALASLNNLKFPYTLTIGKKLKLQKSAQVEFDGYNVKVTAKSGLNIRRGPSTSTKVIGSIPKGTKLYISREENGWGYTRYQVKGTVIEGYVYLSYTKRIK